MWQRITDVLRDRIRVESGREATPTAAIIDSQSVRGADTVPGRSRGWDNGKKIGGRKRHIAVDTMGLLLAVVVTAASIQDRDGAHPLLALMRNDFHHHADLGRRGLYRQARDLGEQSSTSYRHHRRTHRPRLRDPATQVGGRADLRLDQQTSTLCPRLRNLAHPPRSHDPTRHHHDHVTTPDPQVTGVPGHSLRNRPSLKPGASDTDENSVESTSANSEGVDQSDSTARPHRLVQSRRFRSRVQSGPIRSSSPLGVVPTSSDG